MISEQKTIIGICGNARCGKDTMAALIQEVLADIGVRSKKINLADCLKEEVSELVMSTLGIDVFTQNTEEKTIIRPLLVSWGTHVRRKLDENVWVKKAEEKMNEKVVYLVPDIRFQNELDWLRGHRSYCLYVERVDENGDVVPPANEEEARNNPILREQCDFQLQWITVGDGQQSILKPVAVEVLEKTIDEKEIALWTETFR